MDWHYEHKGELYFALALIGCWFSPQFRQKFSKDFMVQFGYASLLFVFIVRSGVL